MKFQLIDNCRRDATRLWTVRIGLGQAAIGAAQTANAFYTPGGNIWPPIAVFVVGLLVAAARLVKQKKVVPLAD